MRRRGGAYVMVLVISSLVTVLGVGSLLVRGRALETAGVRSDAAGARALSVSAVQLALESIADGAAVGEVAQVGNWIDERIGTGTVRARVAAEVSDDVVTLRGEGAVGAARALLDVDVMHRADYRERALYLGPGGHWPLDEASWAATTGARDVAGNSGGVWANIFGVAGQMTGPDGGPAPYFDDDNDPVGIGARDWMNATEGTLAMWVYRPAGSRADGVIVVRGNSDKVEGSICIAFDEDVIEVAMRTRTGNRRVDGSVALGRWVHIAVRMSDSDLSLFADGVLLASQGSTATSVGVPGDPLIIGGAFDQRDSTFSDPMMGSVREVSFFTRALSDTEIAWMYGALGAWEVSLEPPVVVAGSYRWAVE